MHVVLDESRTADNGFTFMAGVVARPGGWDAMSEKWLALLTKHKIDALHATDFLNAEGAYRGLNGGLAGSREKRIAVLCEFATLIRTHAEAAVIVGVDSGAFRMLLRNERKRISPDLWAFYRIVAFAHESMEAAGLQEGVDFVIDDNPEVAIRMYSLWRKTRKLHSFARHFFRSISFADDKHTLPLQAADLMANIVLQEHKRGLDAWNSDSPFKNIFPPHPNGGDNIQTELWDEEMLSRHISALRDAAAST